MYKPAYFSWKLNYPSP